MITNQEKKLMMVDFQKEIDGYLVQWIQAIEELCSGTPNESTEYKTVKFLTLTSKFRNDVTS